MPRSDGRPRQACCMVSEILEESGIDRVRARQLRRQILEGIILLCRWQLERMEEPPARARAARRRRVPVE